MMMRVEEANESHNILGLNKSWYYRAARRAFYRTCPPLSENAPIHSPGRCSNQASTEPTSKSM